MTSTNSLTSMKPEDIQYLLDNLGSFSHEEQLEIEQMVDALEQRSTASSAQGSLIEFCRTMDEEYLVGTHHKILSGLLEDIEQGKNDKGERRDRICVSIPPRHGKSHLVSTFYIAWYLGHHPTHKVMLVSHSGEMATDWGRKIRNLISTDAYQNVFPGVRIAKDSKSAGRWSTNHGGEFFSCGIGAGIAGRGAHLLVVDDPHNEQDILNGNFDVFDKAYEWFTYGARTRLMPNGKIAIVHTRWFEADLIGRVTADMANNEQADQYEVFEFPAIMEVKQSDGSVKEKALWPDFFDLNALYRTKASMPAFQWNAQFQQKPTAQEAAIVKRDWWRDWMKDDPPKCEYIIMTLDAAAESHNRADYTALTTWGVFWNDEEEAHNIILLDAIKKRVEYPDLKDLARKEYDSWEPDVFMVEKKSSGTPLFQELRRAGVFVSEYTPHRGSGDKTARLNSVADIVRSGLVWTPRMRWAEELVDEVAGFPFMQHDDQVDCTIMALMRFRQGGFIRLPSDPEDEIPWFKSRRGKRHYY